MQKLHELAQNQLFELRAQSGNQLVFKSGHTLTTWICNIVIILQCSLTSALCLLFLHIEIIIHQELFYVEEIDLLLLIISEEERAAKQTEVNLLMDEVERAQTMLLGLEREKVLFTNFYLISKCVVCVHL